MFSYHRSLPSSSLLAGFLAVFSLLLAPAHAAIFTSLADGFDFPVGKPSGDGFYKARGYQPNGHLGEDWNGRGGGNTDLGEPVYSVGNGVVVYSANFRLGWGNVVIIRHAYRASNGRIQYVDSLYGHLHERSVSLHDRVSKGQKVGTIGNNNGMYWAHLHLEMRKNLAIGMNRSDFARDSSNYLSPTSFIHTHRTLPREFRMVPVPTLEQSKVGVDRLEELARNNVELRRLQTMQRAALRQSHHHSVSRLSLRPTRGKEEAKGDELSPSAQERDKIKAFWASTRAQRPNSKY